jgi:hypothetical protein
MRLAAPRSPAVGLGEDPRLLAPTPWMNPRALDQTKTQASLSGIDVASNATMAEGEPQTLPAASIDEWGAKASVPTDPCQHFRFLI